MQKNDNSSEKYKIDRKYQLLIDAIDEGVILFEPNSTQMIAANSRAFELLVIDFKTDNLGDVRDMIAPEDIDSFTRTISTLCEGKVVEGDFSFIIDDGNSQKFHLSAVLIQEETQPIIQAILRPTNPCIRELALDTESGEGGSERVETIPDQKGNMHTIVLRKVPLVDGRGKTQGTIVVGRDITEQRNSELSIRQRAGELKVLHDLSLNISTIHDQSLLHKNIIAYAARLLNADGGCLYLCDPDLNRLNLCAEFPSHTGQYRTMTFNIGEGAAGWVAKNGKPLNISQSNGLTENIKLTDTEQLYGAMLLTPMVWQNQVKGVMQVFIARGERKFIEPEQELLTLYANQAIIAIENARLFEAERSAHEQAELFRDVAQVVNESLVLDEVLHRIIGQLKRVLTFATCSVLLFRENGKPALVAGSGYKDEKLTSRIASEVLVQSPIIKRMAKDLQPVVIPDVRLHPDWIWVQGAEHVRSFMGVPIVSQQQLIGVLMVDSITIDFFKQSDLNKSKILAHFGWR